MMISSIFSACALLAASVQALVPNLPRETSQADTFDPRGWSPRPTDSPSSPLGIFGRQAFPHDAGIALVAPDRTCGYIAGLQGAPFLCTSGYKCVMFSASGNNYGPMACCTTGMECKIRTDCVESADYWGTASNSACGDGCRKDAFTLKCTDSSKPYCAGLRFTSPNIQDYWCDETSAPSAWRSAATTFTGQTDQIAWSTVDKALLFAVSSSSGSSVSTGTRRTRTSATDSAGTKGPSLLPTSSSEGSGSSTPVGAIVGGVLGGIALIALIGFGIFFIRRKYNNQPVSSPKEAPYQPPPQDPYAYQPPPQLGARSEMDSQDYRTEYMPNATPQPYSVGGVTQHYDPPIEAQMKAYSAPLNQSPPPAQELYTPPQNATGYQPVPAEMAGGRDH